MFNIYYNTLITWKFLGNFSSLDDAKDFIENQIRLKNIEAIEVNKITSHKYSLNRFIPYLKSKHPFEFRYDCVSENGLFYQEYFTIAKM